MLRRALANTLLTIVSIGVGYFICEMVFFGLLLPNVTLHVRPHLQETAEVLVQNSKKGYAPHDYVALLGDSYAEGVGDWLLANGGNEALPFGPAHLLHAATGRDVVSFGRGGIGSAESLVRQPSTILAGSDCWMFPRIEPPAQIFAFFYEGNDLADNWEFLSDVNREYGSSDAGAIGQFLREQFDHHPIWRCHLHFGDMIARMAKFYVQYHQFTPSDLKPKNPGGNPVIVGGRATEMPSPLEGPSLEFDAVRTNRTMEVFGISLAWLRARFGAAPITVVYIPSPLSAYRKTGAPITYFRMGEAPAQTTEPDRIDARSLELCRRVQDSALRAGVGFLDTRPAVRTAAAAEFIHGPIDWFHFNEKGYRVLAALLAARLGDPLRRDACE